MSHVHEGPLATYNSLTDPNLAGFFGNTRMRRHLRKNGLVNRRGEIISENQYRLNMARKEHKKHVKNLLAQAIVHKTLDLERYRQVEIKKKLEEIAKIEMVRRVRATRGRKGDEELLPYLTPRSHSRPQSGPSDASSSSYKRPKSAPGQPRHRVVSKTFSNDPYDEVIYMDNDGYPVEPPPASERYETKNTIRDSDIDTRHLYALDSEALHQYALRMSKAEKGRDGATSPYLISQYPVPPKSGRPSRSSSGRSRSGLKSPKSGSGRSSPRRSARMSGRPEYPAKRTQGSLMLHRQEPAMMHQGEIQTLCEITMKYHGPNLTLPRDQFDPTQEVSIEQQHCGGNTLPVFKERIQGGSTFSFVSRRHRGYPFSLTVYIDGRVDCRVSTCCEYKHAIGVKLGGKMGHFSLTGITGATPCYKCKLSVQAPPRSLKLKKGAAKKKKEPQGQEEVTVSGTPRTPITEKKQEKEGYIAGKSDDDNYDDDFEDEESKGKYTDDFEDDSKDKRHIIGLRDNETRVNGQTVSVDVQEKEKQDEKEGILPPHRRIEGYSSEDEDAEGRGITYPKADVQKKGQRSSSSSSSSSSRSRSRSRSCSRSRSHSRSRSRSRSSSRSRSRSSSSERPKSPKQPERIIHARPRTPEPSGEKKISREETVQKVVDVSTARSDGGDTARSSGSTSSDLTTETESSPRSLTQKPPVTGGPTKRTRSSSSSSSSTLTSDTEDEKFTRKKREEKIRQENEQRRKQEEEERKKEQDKREQERKQKLQMEEERRQVEEEERKKRFMLQRNESQERLKKMEEDRKAKEAELNRQKEEEKQKRMADEERIKRDFEKQLSFIQSQRESDTATSLSDERKPKIVEKTDIGRTSEQTKRRGSTSSTASSSSSSSSSSGREYVVKKEEKPQPALRAVARKSSSSSSSESEKETKPPIIKQQVQKENVMQRKHSSSSSTSSKSEEETKQSTFPVMTRQMESLNAEYKDLAVQRRHSTSSSSSSEDESEAEPKSATTSAKITAAETKPVLPVKSLSPVEAKKSSSTSSLTSSSSDSESDSQADKPVPKPVQSVKPPSPVEAKKPSPSTSSVTSSSSDSESSSEADKPVPKPRTPSPELKRPEPQRAAAPHAARESSGSSSDSDSSSEADKPVPKPRTPSPELKKPAPPMAAAPHAARESSGSSSDSDSSSSLSDSEDKSPVKQDVVKQEESQQSSPKLEKKPFEMRGGGIAQQRDREETEDSSTDSSSSSDSESDSEEKAKPKTATDESDHNYGGHDPDNVAQSSGSKDGSLGLTSVPAPKAHFGSILPMVEGDTALELSGVKLTDSQVAELSNFITKNHDLKSVTLRNSALEDTSFLSLARALQMSPSNPSIVNLGLNNLGPDSMTAFANVIKNKPAMEVIILNGNPLGDVGCKLLCDALIKTKDPFPFLRRTSGYLSPAEARQQKDQGKEVKYGSHNDEGCNLKQLDLSETKIGDAGIGEISRFLDSNKTLTSLSLSGNTAVTASGWERLGQAMKKNTTLKSMSIDHAGIGDTGLEGLVKGLRVNVGLRSLELEHAGLTEKGGLILRDLVKGNTSIVDLSITRGNDISENMVEEIRKYLALNRSMLS